MGKMSPMPGCFHCIASDRCQIHEKGHAPGFAELDIDEITPAIPISLKIYARHTGTTSPSASASLFRLASKVRNSAAPRWSAVAT